jgi:hypothetical protein
MDPREAVSIGLRLHPRVMHQNAIDQAARERLAAALPPLVPFGTGTYHGFIAVLDWDHRLPSRAYLLRLHAYTSAESVIAGEAQFKLRTQDIAKQDRFPEFDVPDYEGIEADEIYEGEVSLEGTLTGLRLTSPWRRELPESEAEASVEVARNSPEFAKLRDELPKRAPHLGDLEAVGWCPPCESSLPGWTLDVWYLTAFDGQVGRGRSLLVDPQQKLVVALRDFTVRVG